MKFHVVTLFPQIFGSYLNESILGRAQGERHISVAYYSPRDFAYDKHRTVDEKPYGGGPGMVMKAEPILKAVEAVKKKIRSAKTKVILFSPSGKLFTNGEARKLKKNYKHLILIAGRYEGVDARVKKILKAEEYSIGPYVLTGGEIPALIVIDAITRQIPGVLGNLDSIEENRIASPEVYTRPEVLTYKQKKYKVPKVLLSGNHKEIDAWRTGRKRTGST